MYDALSRNERSAQAGAQPLSIGERGGPQGREIAADADEQGYPLNDKPVSIAIREIAEGKVDLSVPEQH